MQLSDVRGLRPVVPLLPKMQVPHQSEARIGVSMPSIKVERVAQK